MSDIYNIKTTNKYEDIIHLQHPTSANHPQMPIEDRAAQFSPLRLLRGMRMLSGKHSGGWRNGFGRWNREMERKQVKMKNKNLKNVGALIILLLAVIAAILIVCKYRLDKKKSAQPVTIGNLANLDSERANCVYVRENGKYVPFLVITNNYEDGYTLLLRKRNFGRSA